MAIFVTGGPMDLSASQWTMAGVSWVTRTVGREFTGAPELEEVMAEAGVVDEPDILFLTHALSTDR